MDKLHLDLDLNNLTKEDKEKFLELVEKAKQKPFNPFERVQKKDKYYWIDCIGNAEDSYEYYGEEDNYCFDAHNYFNDKEFAEHQALRELLNRKLMKFSYENGGVDIEKDRSYKIVISDALYNPDILTPLFISEEVAQRAIKEVIEPFLKEHPNFKWWG